MGDPLHVGCEPHGGLHAVQVDLELPGVDAHVAGDALPVVGGEVRSDVGDLGEQVDVGGERGHGAVEEQQVLDEEHELLGHARPVGEQRLGELADLAYELVGRHGGGVLHGLVEAQVAHDGVQVRVLGQGAEVAQGSELEAHIVHRAAHEQAQEGQPPGLVEAAGDAVVEQGDPEHAEEHGALQEGHHAGPHHRRGVDAGGVHAGHVVPGEPGEPLHHEDAAGDELGVGPGHDQGPLARLGQDAGDVEHVLRFEAEVQLLDDGLGEELDQGGRVRQRGHRDAPHKGRGDPAHGGQVAPHQLGDLRALHLDHHGLARLEGRGVHLGDGRGRHRSAVEAREHLLEGGAQVLLDGGADRLVAFGRHLVAQQAELGDQLLGEDSLPRGQDLPELDVGRPQALEGPAQPAGQPGPRR